MSTADENDTELFAGEIISISTVIISARDTNILHPLCLVYIDDYHHDIIMFLRIFYLRGPPTQDCIGKNDMVAITHDNQSVCMFVFKLVLAMSAFCFYLLEYCINLRCCQMYFWSSLFSGMVLPI